MSLLVLLLACSGAPPVEVPAAAPAVVAVESPPPEAPREPEAPPLPDRSPAVATPLIVPDGALRGFFEVLAAVDDADGETGPIARILSWGDSTIAGDGIVSTVRARLQDQFGDGGPGFLTAHVDPNHAYREGVAQWASGDWESLSITFGGAPTPRYGLAGIVSTATGQSRSVLGGRESDGQRQLLHRFDVYYQYQPDGGSFSLGGAAIATGAAAVRDAFLEIPAPTGARFLALETLGDGPVTVYGAALETDGPGVTWETFGVAGSGVGSMGRQLGTHIRAQIARRDPALLVYWTGANEWGYESVTEGEGEAYQEVYEGVVERLRAGAPDASCLLIGPLDQGTWETEALTSEPALEKLIAVQKRAAESLGCAFWDARAAMGGEGSFKKWFEHDPPLARDDRLHLNDDGKVLIGHCLADALLQAYTAYTDR